MDFRVALDIYNGPLDLLLHLIKRDELNIYDIPIHHITEAYLQHMTLLRELAADSTENSALGPDINIAGDFLVMAATLMEIKSAMLLPKAPADETGQRSAAADLTDPRYELVQQLLEYKRLKDSANLLDQQQRSHQNRFPRFPAALEDATDEPPPIDIDEVQVWDLLEHFSRLMNEVGHRKTVHEVTGDDTPIELHAADIEDRLSRDGKLTLASLIVGQTRRSEMIGVFLAVLELIRQKKILVSQAQAGGDIEIESAPEEHRRQFAQASLQLAEEPSAETISTPVVDAVS